MDDDIIIFSLTTVTDYCEIKKTTFVYSDSDVKKFFQYKITYCLSGISLCILNNILTRIVRPMFISCFHICFALIDEVRNIYIHLFWTNCIQLRSTLQHACAYKLENYYQLIRKSLNARRIWNSGLSVIIRVVSNQSFRVV